MQAHEVETTVITADPTETAPVLETTVGNEQPVVTVPYSSLHPSPLNARTKPLTGIPALAVSIRAKGLMQNNRNLSGCYITIAASTRSADSHIWGLGSNGTVMGFFR